MIDTIKKIKSSEIQYGKLNNRVYIMDLDYKDVDEVINASDRLCRLNELDKIFIKTSSIMENYLLERGFKEEARIPKFYKNSKDCIFMGKYYSTERENETNPDLYKKVLAAALEKKPNKTSGTNFHTINLLTEKDAESIVELYKKVFKTYPFPIFDINYIKQTMKDNVIYCGIKDNGKVVSVASAEVSTKTSSAEMTDFATDPQYRGYGFALSILKKLEEHMKSLKINKLYTIARSKSYGMNITFNRAGYKYSGRLKNNTNISGNIESMNVWYKIDV